MTDVTLMTSCASPAMVLPSLALLSHRVRVLALNAASVAKVPERTILLIDARNDFMTAKSLCGMLHAAEYTVPIILVITEGGFTVVNSSWGISDVIVTNATPAEVEGRLRFAAQKGLLAEVNLRNNKQEFDGMDVSDDGQVSAGDLVIDTRGYTVSVYGKPIDLAYKEFELLKYFIQHPRRVFTRAQLLQEVWGYDYYGGTRTVDVHIRRLRAKLGSEYEHVIGTVRNVGYRFDPPDVSDADTTQDAPSHDASQETFEEAYIENHGES